MATRTPCAFSLSAEEPASPYRTQKHLGGPSWRAGTGCGGIPQDFSGTEAYPGTNTTAINVTGTFNYTVLTLTPAQLAGGPYVQIGLDT